MLTNLLLLACLICLLGCWFTLADIRNYMYKYVKVAVYKERLARQKGDGRR